MTVVRRVRIFDACHKDVARSRMRGGEIDPIDLPSLLQIRGAL
jgi:hypothetical protein